MREKFIGLFVFCFCGVSALSEERFEGPSRLASALSKLSETVRDLDPFGLPMNAEVSSLESFYPEVVEEEDLVLSANSSLAEALQKVNVTGVMPSQQTVLIGGRSLRVGEVLQLHHDEHAYYLKVSRVSLAFMEFINLDSQESVKFPLQFKPLSSSVNLRKVKQFPTGAQPRSRNLVVR